MLKITMPIYAAMFPQKNFFEQHAPPLESPMIFMERWPLLWEVGLSVKKLDQLIS